MEEHISRYKFIDPTRLFVQPFEKKLITDSPQRNIPSPSLNLNKEYHQEIMSYMDKVTDKTVLAILVQEEKIKQKKLFHLINQLERTQQSLLKLEEKYKQQESIETHPQIKEDVDNLLKVEQYKVSLVQKASQLNQNLEENNKNIMNLQQQVFQKRLYIRGLTQESWGLLSDQQALLSTKRHHQSLEYIPKVTKNEDLVFITGSDAMQKSHNHLKRTNTILPPLLPKTSKFTKIQSLLDSTHVQKDKVNELLDVLQMSREVQTKIIKLKDDIARKCNKFSSTRNLLKESLQTTMKYFENKQKIVGVNGYADSLYFDISTVNATTRSAINDSLVQITQSPQKNPKKNCSNIKNILYDKLQSIMLNMIKDKQTLLNQIDFQNTQEEIKEPDSMEQSIRNSIGYQNQSQIGEFKVSIDQFLTFSPQQVQIVFNNIKMIGLLKLNPILLKELVSVFDIKQKSVGLNGNKVKILIQQNI